MLYVLCQCGHRAARPDEAVGKSLPCDDCGRIITTMLASQCKADGSLDSRIAFHARLTIGKGPGRVDEQILLAGPGVLTIGNLPEKNLRLIGEGVSRTHAQLICEANLWRIEDQGSRNGTKVNGTKIQTRILRNNDKVGVGEYEFTFSLL